MTRQEANREILKILSDVVEMYPDMRFGQLLGNLGVVSYRYQMGDDVPTALDPYNDESVSTLRNVQRHLVGVTD